MVPMIPSSSLKAGMMTDTDGRYFDVGDGPVEEGADEAPQHVEADGDRVAGEDRVLA